MTTDLHRTNLNLYTSDVEYLRKHYGFGWTERAREALHNWVLMQKAVHSGGHQPLGNLEVLKTDPDGTVTFRGVPVKVKSDTTNLSRRYVDNTEVPDDE